VSKFESKPQSDRQAPAVLAYARALERDRLPRLAIATLAVAAAIGGVVMLDGDRWLLSETELRFILLACFINGVVAFFATVFDDNRRWIALLATLLSLCAIFYGAIDLLSHFHMET
jgi:hypothetical protein